MDGMSFRGRIDPLGSLKPRLRNMSGWPFLLLNFAPRSGWATGGSLLLHYNFLRGGGLVPFIEVGGGASERQFCLADAAGGFPVPLEALLRFRVRSVQRT